MLTISLRRSPHRAYLARHIRIVNGSGPLFHMTTLRHALVCYVKLDQKIVRFDVPYRQRRIRPILCSSFAIQFFECTGQVFQRDGLAICSIQPEWAPAVEKCDVNMLRVDVTRSRRILLQELKTIRSHAPNQLDVWEDNMLRGLLVSFAPERHR